MREQLGKLGNVSSVIAVYGVTLFALVQAAAQLAPSAPATSIPLTEVVNFPVAAEAEPPKIARSGTPVHLTIQSLGMDRPVEAGTYSQATQTWYVSPRGIHFATLSSPANDLSGNTLIYGHNNKDVFGPLKRLQPGDEATVHTDNGHIFAYSYVGRSDYAPSDTSVFGYDGQPLLTLMTCSGRFNEIRTFYTFKLERVENV